MAKEIELKFKINMARLRAMEKKAPRRIETALDKTAYKTVSAIIESFDDSPPGREYKRGRGRVHHASQPGRAPRVDYGTLRASLRVDNLGEFKRAVATGVEYAEFLEFGGGKMAARPFMEPAFEGVKNAFEWGIRDALDGR